MKYPIAEIFRSIQGEGVNAGRLATFIRFAGCNLSCTWCDTDHTMKEELTASEIIKRVVEIDSKFVVLTGGEPTLHLSMGVLEPLQTAGYELAIETNGVMPIQPAFLRYLSWITVSPKWHMGAEFMQRFGDELKIIWDGVVDPSAVAKGTEFDHYVVQPEWTKRGDALKHVLKFIEDNPKWRLSTQLHKILCFH